MSGILTNEEKQGSQGFKKGSIRPHKVEPQGVAGSASKRASAALAIFEKPKVPPFHPTTFSEGKKLNTCPSNNNQIVIHSKMRHKT